MAAFRADGGVLFSTRRLRALKLTTQMGFLCSLLSASDEGCYGLFHIVYGDPCFHAVAPGALVDYGVDRQGIGVLEAACEGPFARDGHYRVRPGLVDFPPCGGAAGR